MIFDVATDVPPVSQCAAGVFIPDNIPFGQKITAPEEPFNTVALGTFINKQGVSDNSGQDDLYVYIYSDASDKMVKCGDFKIQPAGIIDFQGLQIPCNNYIVIAFLKYNSLFPNVAYSSRIPCHTNSVEGTDFVLRGGGVKNIQDMISTVFDYAGLIPGLGNTP